MAPSSRTSFVAGADGCPAGWIAVFYPVGQPEAAEWRIFPSFADLLAFTEAFAAIAVDMPIGMSTAMAAKASVNASRSAKLGKIRHSAASGWPTG